uniref:G-protein coupled receptors family 2 profile 2 domain-containing protein n=1 Tax=Strigamia maritima TaxID=126957 RepID=T1IM95_STRMM
MISLFWFYVLELVFQLLGSYISEIPRMCYLLGISIQYALISAFCWLNVVTFNMWRHFHPQRILYTTHRASCLKFTCQSLYAWMVPALLIMISNLLILTKAPIATTYNSRCLISMYKNSAQVVSYYTSECYPLIINVVLIVLICVNLRKMSLGIAIANKGIHSQMFRMYMKLLLVTGVCWVLQVLEWATVPFHPKQSYWIVPDLLNALQGLILFLIYNCSGEVRVRLRQHYSNTIRSLRRRSAPSSQSSASSYLSPT